ncbi:hypothetical protein SEPCBS119000_001604 [Sporothrix epigloea]|uniref:Uncharacterized protein n=1 Tax=Sporothrix epigloea TaxID=1892477 RepID=A0ABP0DDA2_9PEZI
MRVSTPPYTNVAALHTPATPHDIRATCQAAQRRIMRLQQATNNQVGLTSAIRDMWFEELRQIAQGFIAAQQASAKLEQAFNTERAQLQGSLSSALNERDLRTAEREASEQEVQFLRARVSELLSQIQGDTKVPDNRFNNALPKNCNSWAMKSVGLSAGNRAETTQYVDAVSHLFSKSADNYATPHNTSGTSTPLGNGSFKAFEQGPTTALNHNQHNSNISRISGGRNRSQSKFFVKNSNSTLVQRPASAYGNGNGHITSDHIAGDFASGRVSRSHGANGLFKLPPSSPSVQQRLQLTTSTISGWQTDTETSPESVGAGFRPSLQNQKGHGHSLALAPRTIMTNPSRSETPASISKELTLFRNETEFTGGFAPGVNMQPGSGDEERVCDIFKFFNSIKDWVDKYCGFPNVDKMRTLSQQHPRLWEYACSVTYPNNRNNAASHSLFMLCNESFRSFFITRLVIQYVVQQMWSPQAWEGLDEQLTEVLESVKHRLDLKYGYDAVLQPHERHALVEKRSRAIFDFMHQTNWNKSKSLRITQATARFKDVALPMMNMEAIDLEHAHRELVGICEDALRLSAILNTSRLSFQFIFNECGIKFSEQSHRALNSSMSARELQAHHWRLMCVVTPGITYRNDAGVSVDPRFLAKANVLLMQ